MHERRTCVERRMSRVRQSLSRGTALQRFGAIFEGWARLHALDWTVSVGAWTRPNAHMNAAPPAPRMTRWLRAIAAGLERRATLIPRDAPKERVQQCTNLTYCDA